MDAWKGATISLAILVIVLSFLLWRSGNKESPPAAPAPPSDEDTRALKAALENFRDKSKNLSSAVSGTG